MTPKSRHAVRIVLAAGLALSVADGCSGPKPPEPTRIEARVRASPDLNPDPEGRPSPLVVRIYQLASPSAFNNGSFYALYDRDKSELGATMKGREELELRPGQALELKRTLDPDVKYIGILAGYRNIESAKWRAVSPVEPHETTQFVIQLTRTAVEIVRSN